MSLALQLVASAERNPRADAVVAGDVRWDYATLLAKVQATAGGLRSTGVVPGGRVVVALRNGPEMLALFWATQWLGAWFVPVNWRLKPADIGYCVSDAEATVFAFEPDTANVPVPAGVASFDAVSPGGLPAGEPVGEPAVASWDEPALMLYTSGTTGRPKGVPRSHRAEWTAALAHTIQCRYVPGERTLGVMPWYHTMGMRSLLAMVALDGCAVVQPAFSAAAALDSIAAERIGSLYLAPTLFHDLVREARSRPGPAPRVPRLAYAGAPMTGALVASCRDAFDPEVFVNHYGSTEIYT
ncbi:MAG: class I adenylate-forming enzyme family protein, partial [Acidimicrobiales bacterium]